MSKVSCTKCQNKGAGEERTMFFLDMRRTGGVRQAFCLDCAITLQRGGFKFYTYKELAAFEGRTRARERKQAQAKARELELAREREEDEMKVRYAEPGTFRIIGTGHLLNRISKCLAPQPTVEFDESAEPTVASKKPAVVSRSYVVRDFSGLRAHVMV